MRKAINENFGGLEVIKLVDAKIPKAGKGEVLVKVKAAGLNPKDVLIRKGKFKRLTGKKTPQSIGFDFSGIIEEPNKSNYKIGESVFGMINGWQGRCCAEYVNVSVNELETMPQQLTYEEAAGISLAGQTALQAIRDIGKLKERQNICINGASGGVGSIAIQIAKELGGIVTTVSSTKNTKFCKSLGADTCLSYTETNILESNQKFDVFFDVFGNLSFNKTKNLLGTKGRYVTTVPKPEIFKEQIWNVFRSKKAKMIVVKSKKDDLNWLSEKISTGKITPVIDKVYSFDKIRDAQKHIESKRAIGKIILKIENDT